MDFNFYDTHARLRRLWPLSKAFGMEVIEISRQWREGEIPDTPLEFQHFLEDRLADAMLRIITPAPIRRQQTEFFRELVRNPVSAIFLDLMRATESTYFVQWLQDSMAVNVFAMEPAYGYGRDFMKHYRKIPEYDPAAVMVDDEGYRYTRWRDQKASELMREAGGGARILSIASGALPELRFFDYPVDILRSQEIVCYDPAEISLRMFFEPHKIPTDSIRYHQLGLADAMNEELCYVMGSAHQYDLIMIKGYLSYALPRIATTVPAFMQLLQRPGTKFAFDLQLANWTMQRNGDLFLWARGKGINFELLENYAAAETLVQKVVQDAALPVEIDISQPPDSGEDAVGVFVTLERKP